MQARFSGRTAAGFAVFSSLVLSIAVRAASESPARVDVVSERARLLREFDRDRDKKLTVLDRPTRAFPLKGKDGSVREVRGAYFLSNLLQELSLAQEGSRDEIDPARIFETPVVRLSRQIRELFWDGLTRRIDERGLAAVLVDSKAPSPPGRPRLLYVSADDSDALARFERLSRARPDLRFEARALPRALNVASFRELRRNPGLLALATRPVRDPNDPIVGEPFVVPGGRFNEMYGWDSYFESLGLIADGRIDLARSMADNLVYQIENYGQILNANRSYYLNRSQPPFLTSLLAAVYERLPKSVESKAWLARGLRAAIAEYENVWTNDLRLTRIGLSRYYGGFGRAGPERSVPGAPREATVMEGGADAFSPPRFGIPPETEPGAFDSVLGPLAKKRGLSIRRFSELYESGKLREPALEAFFEQDLSVRESGHDTTYRWQVEGEERASDFATVDLNALLYKYELDLARLIGSEFAGAVPPAAADAPSRSLEASAWRARSRARKQMILSYLWDPKRGSFFDWDVRRGRRSQYVSATAFYPLWAHDPTDVSTRLLSPGDALRCARFLLSELEEPGGLAATSRRSLETLALRKAKARQWEWPNGWAPHQMMAWRALADAGLSVDANRLIYKWLYAIARNAADFNGVVPEKFDVVARSHAVFAEYGNVGSNFSYITREGFGWMNASIQVGLAMLDRPHRAQLEGLVPPEWLNFTESKRE